MKRLLLLVVAMLLATISFAQVKKSPAPERYGWDQKYPLYGEVKSVTISHYEYVSKFGKYEKGELKDRQIYYFNEVGDVERHDKDWEYSLYYKYDAGNVEVHKYNYYGTLETCTANKCDENGRVLESAVYDNTGVLQTMTFNEYDSEDNHIGEIVYDSSGTVTAITCYGYDEQGNCTSIEMYDSYDSLAQEETVIWIHQSFTYDSAGNVTECLISSGSVHSVCLFHYDANGNLVEMEYRNSLYDSLEFKNVLSYDESGDNLESIITYEPRFDGRKLIPVIITEYDVCYVGEEVELVDITKTEEPKTQAPVEQSEKLITNMIDVVKDTAIIEDGFSFADFTEEEIIVEEVEAKEEVVDDQVFVKVERMPSFAGGDLNTFRTWFGSEFKYPAIAAENGIQGRLTVKFVVEKDGRLTNIEFLQSPDPIFNDEVRRVLNKSPRWTPGTQQGKPCRVSYVLPIDIRLQ